MAAFDGATDAANARHARLTTFGSAYPKTLSGGTLRSWRIAVGSVRFGGGKVERIRNGGRLLWRRGLNDQAVQHCSRLLAVVGRRRSHGGAQRHAMFICR